jgi:hypothetical protein
MGCGKKYFTFSLLYPLGRRAGEGLSKLYNFK